MADATVAGVCLLGGSYGLPIHISVLPSLRLLLMACGRGALATTTCFLLPRTRYDYDIIAAHDHQRHDDIHNSV